MPKPRRRIESSIDPSTASSLSDIREAHRVTSDDPGMSTPRKDYMTIPMPAEKEEPEKDWGMSGNDPAESTSFTSKWKKAAQTLISKPSLKLGKRKKQKPDTRIEIENLDQTEPSNDNIEMLCYTKNPAKEDRRESLTEFRSDKKTKAMLQAQDDEEIERMKNMYGSPAKDRTEIGTPSKRERRRAEIQDAPAKCFGVMIHSCDLLPMDPNVVHPVVKITILNENGTCITKHKALRSHTEDISSPKNSRRKNEAEKENKKSRSYNKLKANASSKGSGSTTKFTPESVLPIMTQPCKLSYYLPTFAPNWNELVVFEEPFNYIVHPDSTVMLFFEIMDFLPTDGPHNGTTLFGDYRGNEEGWYKIAWGFLKLIGANGVRNVNRKLRLQLYKPEQLPAKLNAKVEVYHWWKRDRRHKIDSTLYVTVRGVVSPTNTAASLRTLLGMGKDDLTQAILESQIHSPKSSKNPGSTNELKRQPGQTDIQMPQWLRLDGQICKIPNKVIKSLPMSPIESLNLTISGNVQCVKFSPCGLKLATGLDTDELHTILVFDVPSGKLLHNIRCHHGLVYDLDWKIIDMKNVLVPNSYYLASASADTTATIWLMKNNSKESPKLVKKLLHPSFVYCIKIHPIKSNLVFTGCFDYAIRIWNIQKTSASQANVHELDTEIIPVIQLDQHESFVNCLTFNQLGTHLYSGDGSGLVFEWTTSSPSKKKSWKMERELTFRESEKNPINSLDLYPSGNRLLVHVRNSSIKVVDLSSFIVLNTLSGLVNEKLQIRSIFSPCGNLILSGSEDSTLCIWDADTGAILHLLTPENHRHCVVTSVDYHPHDYFVAIGLASTISEPNPIMLYTHKQAKPPKMRFHTLAKLTTTFSTDSTSTGPTVPPSSTSTALARGDSTEKFVMIVKKLDAALKLTQRTTASIPEGNGRSSASLALSPEKDRSSKSDEYSHRPKELFDSEMNNSPIEYTPERKPRVVKSPTNHARHVSWGQKPEAPSVSPNKDPVTGDTWAAETPDKRKFEDSPLKSPQDVLVVEEPENGTTSQKVSKVRQKRRQKMRLLYDSSDQMSYN